MPMTEAGFRRIALGLAGAVESAHMNHPDFRASGRIFASLKGDGLAGMVKLPLDAQTRLVREYPSAFAPENGAWGRQGYTRVTLRAVDADTLGEAMTLAWQLVTAAAPRRSPKKRTSRERPRG